MRQTLSSTRFPTTQARRVFPQFGPRVLIATTAEGNYHSAYVSFTRRLSKGLQFRANYTFSRNESNNDESLGVAAITGGSPQIPQDFNDIDAEWSLSAFDRHAPRGRALAVRNARGRQRLRPSAAPAAGSSRASYSRPVRPALHDRHWRRYQRQRRWRRSSRTSIRRHADAGSATPGTCARSRRRGCSSCRSAPTACRWSTASATATSAATRCARRAGSTGI